MPPSLRRHIRQQFGDLERYAGQKGVQLIHLLTRERTALAASPRHRLSHDREHQRGKAVTPLLQLVAGFA